MLYRFTMGWLVYSTATAVAAGPSTRPAGDDWLPEAAEAAVSPASVPVVPIPPAVFGTAASVGLMLLLGQIRGRRWLTLRS